MAQHKDLVGADLHIAKSLTNDGTPVGAVTPGVVGQFCWDTTNKKLYVAEGLTSSDWTESDAAHKADTVNYVTLASRSLNTDGTGAGTQTISISLPIAPKKIRIDAAIADKNFASWGEYGLNSQGCIFRYGAAGTTSADGKMGNYSGNIINFDDGGADRWSAVVSAVSTTSITLTWTKAGNGFTGTAYLRITAETH